MAGKIIIAVLLTIVGLLALVGIAAIVVFVYALRDGNDITKKLNDKISD